MIEGGLEGAPRVNSRMVKEPSVFFFQKQCLKSGGNNVGIDGIATVFVLLKGDLFPVAVAYQRRLLGAVNIKKVFLEVVAFYTYGNERYA